MLVRFVIYLAKLRVAGPQTPPPPPPLDPPHTSLPFTLFGIVESFQITGVVSYFYTHVTHSVLYVVIINTLRYFVRYYRGTSGIIIMYEVCDKTTFKNIPNWLYEINQNCDSSVIKILGTFISYAVQFYYYYLFCYFPQLTSFNKIMAGPSGRGRGVSTPPPDIFYFYHTHTHTHT